MRSDVLVAEQVLISAPLRLLGALAVGGASMPARAGHGSATDAGFARRLVPVDEPAPSLIADRPPSGRGTQIMFL
ncbi:hypothetical protein ACFV0H_32955 [Streptomyces erythrochromogenes]|uniref:hypothetical protein n=1 Tax=Streptomyces erythrochromogenes TaxID=285574 RepID=UPI00224DCA2F|nr:hypothetical protein [Streptomyces erythrochromogenes]MCX5583986.1 hypothetical protein [Streptomyces erythrochromogenes]